MPTSRTSTAHDDLLESAKAKIERVDRGTIVEVTRVIMEMIEDEDGISGEEARRHALAIARALIVDLAPEDEKDWLLAMVDNGTLANIIDAIIGATKGLYNLNRKVADTGGCAQFAGCLRLR